MIFLKLCQYSCQEILHKSLPFWHTLSLPQSPVLHSVPYAEVKFQKSFDFTFSQLGFFLSSVFCYFFSYTQIASLITCLALVGSRDNLATAGHSRHTQALNQHLYNEDSQVGVSFVLSPHSSSNQFQEVWLPHIAPHLPPFIPPLYFLKPGLHHFPLVYGKQSPKSLPTSSITPSTHTNSDHRADL